MHEIGKHSNAKVWLRIPVERKFFSDVVDETIYVIETNVIRRHLTVGQKTVIGMKLEKFYAEKSKQRQEATIPQEGEKGFQCGGNISTTQKGKTRDIMGSKIGVSGRTYEKAKKILDNASPLLGLIVTGRRFATPWHILLSHYTYAHRNTTIN